MPRSSRIACTHFGVRPLPLQVCSGFCGSRYFAGRLRRAPLKAPAPSSGRGRPSCSLLRSRGVRARPQLLAVHHAIVPNVNTIGELKEVWPRLSPDENKLFDAVARTYLAAVMPDYRYRQTTVTLDVRGFEFRASGAATHRSGLARRLPGLAARRREGRGGADAAGTSGRGGRAVARSGDRGQGDAAAAALQGRHADRGDAECLAFRRGRGPARAAEGSEGDRHAGDSGRIIAGLEEAGVLGRRRARTSWPTERGLACSGSSSGRPRGWSIPA